MGRRVRLFGPNFFSCNQNNNNITFQIYLRTSSTSPPKNQKVDQILARVRMVEYSHLWERMAHKGLPRNHFVCCNMTVVQKPADCKRFHPKTEPYLCEKVQCFHFVFFVKNITFPRYKVLMKQSPFPSWYISKIKSEQNPGQASSKIPTAIRSGIRVVSWTA